jgi:hypothetical protein
VITTQSIEIITRHDIIKIIWFLFRGVDQHGLS